MPAIAAAGARALLARVFGQVGRVAAGGVGRRAITGSVVGVTGAGLLGLGGDGDDGDGRGGIFRRRRRKRALTASDKNDIAFITATLGETTGRKFALLIAARS